jgi:hypothetical protein
MVLRIFVIFSSGILISKVLVLRRYLSTETLCPHSSFVLLRGMPRRSVNVINARVIPSIELESSSRIIIIMSSR